MNPIRVKPSTTQRQSMLFETPCAMKTTPATKRTVNSKATLVSSKGKTSTKNNKKTRVKPRKMHQLHTDSSMRKIFDRHDRSNSTGGGSTRVSGQNSPVGRSSALKEVPPPFGVGETQPRHTDTFQSYTSQSLVDKHALTTSAVFELG